MASREKREIAIYRQDNTRLETSAVCDTDAGDSFVSTAIAFATKFGYVPFETKYMVAACGKSLRVVGDTNLHWFVRNSVKSDERSFLVADNMPKDIQVILGRSALESAGLASKRTISPVISRDPTLAEKEAAQNRNLRRPEEEQLQDRMYEDHYNQQQIQQQQNSQQAQQQWGTQTNQQQQHHQQQQQPNQR